MRPRPVSVLAAGVLALSLLGPVTAAADDPEITGPELPDQAATTAEQEAGDVLDEAQAIFEERSPAAARRLLARGGADATMALNQLVRVRDDLSPSERRQADALLARPTDDSGGAFGDEYEVPEEEPVCGDTVCIHYVATTNDAPDMTDGDDENTTPDSVDQALTTAESVNDAFVAAGYRRPDGDGTLGNDDPGDPVDLVDIYLVDIGSQGLYGYCTSDQPDKDDGTWNYWAYCGIDNDYSSKQFPRRSPEENQQVTLAHEYFHAVQFAYDAAEDPWIMEATATWAEDELFDDINDNRQYLKDSQMRRPYVPLDQYGFGSNHYGNWIFFRYLTERWTAEKAGLPTLVRDIWRKMSGRAGDPDFYSTAAINKVLSARGASFTPVYGQFADAIRRPGRTFEEGAAYRSAAPLKTWRLTSSRRSTRAFFTRLDHLTSTPLRYRPGADLRKRDWRLRLKVDMPAARTAPVARVSRYLRNGKVRTSTVRLKATGASTKTVGFSSRNVKYVELVLVNASRRSRCGTSNDTFACWGTPRDDGLRTDFSASIFRR